jgi:cysteine synthase
VPYRCLLPRGLGNVLVAGRCISTDRAVNGSVRIMACCLTTGEAAGVAAALAAVTPAGDVRAVDPAELRTRLRRHGAYLP